MLFNSFDFLVFFPLVCLLYYVIPFRIRHIWLLAASYYFYMCWNPKYALLMLLSTAITYVSGVLIGKTEKIEEEKRRNRRKKIFVAASFGSNLSILFFFKYFNFAVDTINSILMHCHLSPLNSRLDILLPVGISFYTFQALSYTMDVYRGEIYYEKNFLKYALFVSFFPQLVAGPIERSKNLLKQIHVKHSFDWHNVQIGLSMMLFGFFQKLVISDHISSLVNEVYNHYTSYGSVELILASIGFAFQIYCDFGGYSNIAIGAAKVMGFEIMENFNAPYLSSSVAEFWRRWHISLNTWFRDYLYIPLGGNRKGRIRKYINLMIVFLASGLWHGASWHFVAWGGINGIYQIIGDVIKPVKEKMFDIFHVDSKAFSHQLIQKFITFTLVDISWVFFASNNMRHALGIFKRIVYVRNPWILFDEKILQLGIDAKTFHMLCVAILVLVIADLCKYKKIDLHEELTRQGVWLQYLVYLIFIFWILIFGSYGPGFDAGQFIYFQF